MKKPTLLCILDGFGLNPNPEGNAVHQAKKPTYERLTATCPHATLVTYGERVGLPAGQMGNSEVGHLNLGAGREVEQWLLRISRALSGPFLRESQEYQSFLRTSANSKRIHVIGLYSSGGVHSHAEHLQLLLARLSQDITHSQIILHLMSDGRDVSPTSFHKDITQLMTKLGNYPRCSIGSVCGRFYAMDRDKRWERVQVAYDAIALGKGVVTDDLLGHIERSYQLGVTDEFLEPAVSTACQAEATDAYLFFNFREDRMREIVAALCVPDFTEVHRGAPLPSRERVLCFTDYDHTFHLPYLFPQVEIRNHIGEVISTAGFKQLRVAETEKYPHVTYFFNGGEERAYDGEVRALIPSPRDVKTYDQKPEMSAYGVAEATVEGIRSGSYDFIVVNFANCDMVGHSGVLAAGIKAVETTDTCLGQILNALEQAGGQAVIVADHGNAEQMVNYEDGTPHTAHTTFPVPVIIVGCERASSLRPDGALCDVAPTLLKMMNLPQPAEMTGRSLF
jgi:2,3-bisphosphoglycerate-independent phosphoglycerate mutase